MKNDKNIKRDKHKKMKLTVNDLETISAINRIALNLQFMHRILKENAVQLSSQQ